MGLDPAAPPMTFLLVLLHTGTMFAVIVYFRSRWHRTYFASWQRFRRVIVLLVLATAITGIVGGVLVRLIEKFGFPDSPQAEVEQLFGRLELIAPALAAAGVLILVSGWRERRKPSGQPNVDGIRLDQAGWMGFVQGLCLPFRGFSRSGATISTGILRGLSKEQAEDFSFALAVLLTPAVIGREALRLWKSPTGASAGMLHDAFPSSLLGAVFAFVAGVVALRWLSRWLESGRWYVFGIYCLFAAAVVGSLKVAGY